jgi:hypothetical protein
MGSVPRDYQLSDEQRAAPIVWAQEWIHAEPGLRLPEFDDATMERIFGPATQGGQKIRSWGHDDHGVHWLSTRRGTVMHTDPAYNRYTHHLIVRNDGFGIQGINRQLEHPPMTVGLLYCLDAFSPHQVVRDPRLSANRPIYKVQLAVDRSVVLSPEEVARLMGPWLLTHHHAGDVLKLDRVREGAAPRR